MTVGVNGVVFVVSSFFCMTPPAAIRSPRRMGVLVLLGTVLIVSVHSARTSAIQSPTAAALDSNSQSSPAQMNSAASAPSPSSSPATSAGNTSTSDEPASVNVAEGASLLSPSSGPASVPTPLSLRVESSVSKTLLLKEFDRAKHSSYGYEFPYPNWFIFLVVIFVSFAPARRFLVWSMGYKPLDIWWGKLNKKMTSRHRFALVVCFGSSMLTNSVTMFAETVDPAPLEV